MTQDVERVAAAIARIQEADCGRWEWSARTTTVSGLAALLAELFPAACAERAGASGLRWALSNALDATGFDAPSEEIARTLIEAIHARATTKLHLCPLDMAGDLPPLRFGQCVIDRFSVEDIRRMFQSDRLSRRFEGFRLDAQDFSRFAWLVVKEEETLDNRIPNRPFPGFIFDANDDIGAIVPHESRWPDGVEKAIFALLLLPWEDAVRYRQEWRGFRIPWSYPAKADPFSGPSKPPDRNTLTWVPDFVFDRDLGCEIEVERPLEMLLNDGAGTICAALTDRRWHRIEAAFESPIVNPLVRHFMVSAFASDGVDEFLDHMIAVEAALGMRKDRGNARSNIKKRILRLTGDATLAKHFGELFELRNAFVHGRAMRAIPSKERIAARRLARRVVEALLGAAPDAVKPRDEFLDGLI